MKRILATALALIFILAAGAYVTAAASGTLTFSITSDIPTARGESVTIPINVSNNPGFVAVGLVLVYDPDVLEIAGVTAPVAAMPLNSQFELTSTPGNQWISLLNTDLVDWSGNGTVAYVTFFVKTDAPLGASIVTLGFTSMPEGSPANSDGVVIGSVRVPGSINVAAVSTAPPPTNGGFIGGLPDASDNAGSTTANSGSDYGRAPQTGAPDILMIAVGVTACLITSAALWGYVAHCRRKTEDS